MTERLAVTPRAQYEETFDVRGRYRTHMIDLTAAVCIGRGHERLCFRHPADPARVIKVVRPGATKVRNQNRIDLFYLSSLERRGVPSQHLPRQYGLVPTTLGEGLMLDFICDEEGAPAANLGCLLRAGSISIAEARRMLAELYQHLWVYGVAVVDIGLGNVVCHRRDQRWQAVVIDGLGGRYFDLKLRLRARFPGLARRKLRAQWPGWERKFRKEGILSE